MTRFVIDPHVAIRLARDAVRVRSKHQLVAPTLLRSQVLSLLYESVQRREIAKQDADKWMDRVRGLRIRLLGDRVLLSDAWKIADQLGWPGTFDAEYVALTKLQADAFITLNAQLAKSVKHLVTVAPIEVLL